MHLPAQHKATSLVVQCKTCKGLLPIACKPGMGGAIIPRYCNLNTNPVPGSEKCEEEPYQVRHAGGDGVGDVGVPFSGALVLVCACDVCALSGAVLGNCCLYCRRVMAPGSHTHTHKHKHTHTKRRLLEMPLLEPAPLHRSTVLWCPLGLAHGPISFTTALPLTQPSALRPASPLLLVLVRPWKASKS